MQFSKISNPYSIRSTSQSQLNSGPAIEARVSPVARVSILLSSLGSLVAIGCSGWSLLQARQIDWTTDGFFGYLFGWIGLSILALLLALVALITTLVMRKSTSTILKILGCTPILLIGSYGLFVYCLPV